MPTGKRKQWGEVKPPAIPPKPDYIGSNFLDRASPGEPSRRDDAAFAVPGQRQQKAVPSDSDDDVERAMKQVIRSGAAQSHAHALNQEEDEDDYSDSFEEVNATVETVQHAQIESLLKTATEEQLDVLKQSLSHWSEQKPALVGKDGISPRSRYDSSGVQIIQSSVVPAPDVDARNQQQTIGADEDDYIEEDFEEDNDESDE